MQITFRLCQTGGGLLRSPVVTPGEGHLAKEDLINQHVPMTLKREFDVLAANLASCGDITYR
jgi:hypothetical protein